jgi:hypothetical protein
MALSPNWRKSLGVGCSLVALGAVLHYSNDTPMSLLSWIGGGSIFIGGYKVVVEAVDFLDGLSDQLYWNRRKLQ